VFFALQKMYRTMNTKTLLWCCKKIFNGVHGSIRRRQGYGGQVRFAQNTLGAVAT